jgi:hypothetical protein
VFVANMTGNWSFSALAWPVLARSRSWPAFSRCWPSPSARPWAGGGLQGERCIAGIYWLPQRRFRRRWFWSCHRKHRRRWRVGGAADVDRVARSGYGRPNVVRRLAVPDLTTTVLTLTVTGLVADSTPRSVRTRRLISILAMLAGALTGGVLLRWVALAAPLWLAALLLVACATGAYLAARRPQSQAWR